MMMWKPFENARDAPPRLILFAERLSICLIAAFVEFERLWPTPARLTRRSLIWLCPATLYSGAQFQKISSPDASGRPARLAAQSPRRH